MTVPTGPEVQQAVTDFFKLFRPAADRMHLCRTLALLLSEGLKAGILRLVVHEAVIIEDFSRYDTESSGIS
jgi:hypothetical protein